VLIDIDFEYRYTHPYDNSHGGLLVKLISSINVGEDPRKEKPD
jgi:hypothetical protein